MIETRGDYGFKFYEYIYIHVHFSIHTYMYVHIYIDACYFYKPVQLYMCILKKQKIFLGNTRRTYIGTKTKTKIIETFHIPSCVRVYKLKIYSFLQSKKAIFFYTQYESNIGQNACIEIVFGNAYCSVVHWKQIVMGNSMFRILL